MRINCFKSVAMLAVMVSLSYTPARGQQSLQDKAYQEEESVVPESIATTYAAEQPATDMAPAPDADPCTPCGTCCQKACCCRPRTPAPFYVGLGGSYDSGLGDGSRSFGAGTAALLGTSTMGRMTEGYNIDSRLGYWLRPALRGDVSYNYINGTYAWATSFVPRVNSVQFKAHNQSHLVMANTYFHPNAWLCGDRCTFDPYFGGGVGIAFNSLGVTHASDFLNNATINGASSTSFAARATAGILVRLTQRANLDLSYSAISLGTFATGAGLNVTGAPVAPFNGFSFGSNVIGSLNLGLIITR